MSMAKNSVAIIGNSRLAHELLELSREKNIPAALSDGADGVDNSAAMIVETSAQEETTKRELLRKLDARVSVSAVIVTSSLHFAATEIASWTSHPERVVGFATFYPLRDKKVIELAGGLRSQESALKAAEAFFQTLGKEPVRVKDAPGSIFPRILSLIINEAARSLEERVAEAEEIDVAMRLGVNYPLGPLRWADQIGLNEVLAVLEGLQRETGDDRYRPTPLIKKMVLSGRLGEVSGQGFYSYNKNKVK